MRSGPVPSIAFLLVLSMLPASGTAAMTEAPSIGPQVTLSLSPSTQVAQVSYSEYGIVPFNGTVEMDRMPIGRVVVTLSASVDTGWACSCDPSILAFTTNAAQAFMVTVSVPPGTLASLVGILTVNAEAAGTIPSSSDSATANVTVLPYYGLNLECDTPTINISAGGKAGFKVHIQNRGNDNDSFDISIGNAEELRKAGWTVSLTLPTIAFVPAHGSMYFYVNVEAPRTPSMVNEPYPIELTATSRGSRTRGQVQSGNILLHANLKGTELDDPLNQMMIIAVVIVVAVVAALVWRRRRKRIRQAEESGEVPPT